MKNIAFLGAGSWAHALTLSLIENKNRVTMFTRSLSKINNPKYAYEFYKPKIDSIDTSLISYTNDPNKLMENCDYLVLAVPATYIAQSWESISKSIVKPVNIINTIKGFADNNGTLIHKFITDKLDSHLLKKYFSLLGPSHAEELVLRMNTFINIASSNLQSCDAIIKLFEREYLKLIPTNCYLSCEWSSILKNLYSIGAGINDGMGYGINFKAFYTTAVFHELKLFWEQMNLGFDNLIKLAALGDYIATGFSTQSRNYSYGWELGHHQSPMYVNDKFKNITVEGINVSRIFNNYMIQYNLNLPLAKTIYKVIFNQIKVSDFVNFVINYSF